jgi:hypothetical protein
MISFILEYFAVGNVEMLLRRVPPPALQAQAKLGSKSSAGGSVSKSNCSNIKKEYIHAQVYG